MVSDSNWEQIDRVCDDFESQWAAGNRPRIEEFVGRVPPEAAEDLAIELLLVELERLLLGSEDPPQATDYAGRLPDNVIREAFRRNADNVSEAEPWVLDILQSCSALHGLRGECMNDLASRLRIQEFEKGERLMQEGQPSRGLHVLLQGVVEIRVGSSSRLIDRSGQGAVVGEMSLLTGANCTADVVALEPVRTLMLTQHDYQQLCAGHEELEVVLGELVADRLGSRDWDALCGKQLHGYLVRKCLRRGGMGVVYEATHPDFETPIALKMLRHCLIHDEPAVNRFQQEGHFLKSLFHPNIVAVYDIFGEYRTVFLAMELNDGDDLGTLLHTRDEPLGEDIVRRVLGQLAAGLLHAQNQRIVHLDLKPSNVLINRAGVAKLCDFGLSKMLDSEAQGETFSLAGTPRYMAPEQLSAMEVGPESDWYGFGCLGYEMLTGKALFPDADLLELSNHKAKWRPPSDWDIPASDELKSIIAAALHPLPEHRELNMRAISKWSAPVPELVAHLQ